MPEPVRSDDYDAIPHGITTGDVEEFSQGMVGSSTPGLQGRIDRAVTFVRRYCGWHVFPVAVTRSRLDGPNSAQLQLPTLRLLGLARLAESGRELDLGALDWSSRGIVEKVGRCERFTARLGAVEADFEHGHTSCPDVAAVVLAMVARGASSPVSGRASHTVGQRSESFASVRGSFGDVAPFEAELAALSRHRLPALSGFH